MGCPPPLSTTYRVQRNNPFVKPNSVRGPRPDDQAYSCCSVPFFAPASPPQKGRRGLLEGELAGATHRATFLLPGRTRRPPIGAADPPHVCFDGKRLCPLGCEGPTT